jgi:MFS family permease
MLNGYAHRYAHFFKRDLFEIYFLLFFRALGFGMIGIFLPLFLWNEVGFSLMKVIFFFVIMSFAFLLSCFAALKIIPKFGAKHSMVFSYFFLVLGMILIMFLEKWNLMYVLAASIQGFSFGLFWIGFHIDAAVHSRKKDVAEEAGLISFVSVLGAVVGPLVGGLILRMSSFNILFVIALCLFVISIIPLIFSKDVFAKTDFEFEVLFKRENLKYFLGYVVQGIRYTAAGIFWPIFIFMILGSYLSLGWYATIVTLIVGIVGYVFGVIADKFGKGLMIKIFAPFEAIFWIMRVFVSGVLGVFVFGALGNIAGSGIDVPLLAKTYNKKEHIAAFVFFREFSIRIGELICLGVVMVLGTLTSSFILTGVSSLVYLLF